MLHFSIERRRSRGSGGAHGQVRRRGAAVEDVRRGQQGHACDGDGVGRAAEADALEEGGVDFEGAALGQANEGEAAVRGAGASGAQGGVLQ